MTGVDVEALRATLAKAMNRAFVLGEQYWADADSESYAANKRAAGHRDNFDKLKAETLATFDALLAKSAEYDALVADARKLVTQFRHNAQGCTRHEAHAAGTWRSCARELERLLVEEGGDANQ